MSASCDAATNMIKYFKVYQWGYTEEMDDPTPEPATFKGFMAWTDYYWADWEMFVKGLDGRYLETAGTEVMMGLNNRAFVTDYANDESSYWAYWHYYLGGSVEFDVDVSDVGCACAANVYLVDLDDGTCSWGEKGSDENP